jgi:O-antigen ligase
LSGACDSSASERFDGAGRKIVVALLIFVVVTNWYPGRLFTFLFDAGVFLLGVAWAVERAGRGAPIVRSVLLAPLGGIVAWGLAQLAIGSTVYRFETWVSVLHWSALFALFFLSLQFYGASSARTGLRRAMLYFGFALSVVSVVQLFTSDGKVFWLFPTPYKDFVVGPFLNRDHYACFIELVLPLAVVEAFLSRRRRVAHAAMAGAMLATVIAGASRAGAILVTLEAGAISLAALWGGGSGAGRKLASLVRLFALAGIFTAVVGWEVLWQRFQDPDPYRYRREMAISSIEMARDRPWMGFGLGTFESAYPAYLVLDVGLRADHAHNDWLEWAAEGGIPLLVLMAFVALWSARAAWQAPWAAGVVAVFLHSFVDYPLQKPAISAWLFVLLGACAAKARSNARSEGRPAVTGLDASDQRGVDAAMIRLDGTSS